MICKQPLTLSWYFQFICYCYVKLNMWFPFFSSSNLLASFHQSLILFSSLLFKNTSLILEPFHLFSDFCLCQVFQQSLCVQQSLQVVQICQFFWFSVFFSFGYLSNFYLLLFHSTFFKLGGCLSSPLHPSITFLTISTTKQFSS